MIVKKIPYYETTVLTPWMARDDCQFTSRDLRISYGNATRFLASIARSSGTWSPISFMRTNFERMPADFFDPFTAASHAGWEYRRRRAGCHIHMQIAIEWQRSQIFDRVDAIKEAEFRLGTETLTFVSAIWIPPNTIYTSP